MVGISRENPNTRQNRSSDGLISSDCCFCFTTPSCMDESDLKSSLLNLFWATEDGENDDKEEEYIGPLNERGNGHGHRREGGQGQRQRRSSTSSRSPAIPKLPKCRSLDNEREPYGHGRGYHPLGRNGFLSKYAAAPPPVIALSRSSFSTTSDSSTSSSLADTEVNGYGDSYQKTPTSHHYGYGGHDSLAKIRGVGAVQPGIKKKDSTESFSLSRSSQEKNYGARHEQLINSLFEDAKRRNEQKIQEDMADQQPSDGDAGGATGAGLGAGTGVSCNNHPPSYHTPPRRNRHAATAMPSSDKSVASKGSKYSRTSNSSNSELLTPSSHKFQHTLNEPRRLPRFRRLNYFARENRNKNNRRGGGNGVGNRKRGKKGKNSRGIGSSLNHLSPPKKHHHHHHSSSYSPHQSDYSACESMTTSSPCPANVQTFLDENIRLQKDSGKGNEIGTNISANGRNAALQKLNDKMDLLAEVERDGRWANAALTRIPAKEMNQEWRELGIDLDQKGYVETRSMLSVKIGFVSLKYGVLVRWNVKTGLAELILLRKACHESFMKITSEIKRKGKILKERARINNDDEDSSFQATPSFITVSSAQSDHSFYDSLGLDPVASAHF